MLSFTGAHHQPHHWVLLVSICVFSEFSCGLLPPILGFLIELGGTEDYFMRMVAEELIEHGEVHLALRKEA